MATSGKTGKTKPQTKVHVPRPVPPMEYYGVLPAGSHGRKTAKGPRRGLMG